MDFVTTNIRLGADVYQRLRLKAAHERKSLAQLIRDAVDAAYGGPRHVSPQHKKNTRQHDPFFKIIGLGASGIRDGAVHHDRDIYGVEP